MERLNTDSLEQKDCRSCFYFAVEIWPQFSQSVFYVVVCPVTDLKYSLNVELAWTSLAKFLPVVWPAPKGFCLHFFNRRVHHTTASVFFNFFCRGTLRKWLHCSWSPIQWSQLQPHRTVVANFVPCNFGLFRRSLRQPLAEPRLKNTALHGQKYAVASTALQQCLSLPDAVVLCFEARECSSEILTAVLHFRTGVIPRCMMGIAQLEHMPMRVRSM